MPEGDSGRLPEGKRRRKNKEPDKAEERRETGVQAYAHAVMALDGVSSPAALAAEIMRDSANGNEAITGLIFVLRDVLRLRGWLDEKAPIVVDRTAHLQSWTPKLQDDPPRLRLVLDLEAIDVTQVAALWLAQQQRLRVTVRLLSRQLALGEAPAAQDLKALMAAHDAGFHQEHPDWACPACLLRAAEERLMEEAAKQPEWAPGDGPEPDAPPPEEARGDTDPLT